MTVSAYILIRTEVGKAATVAQGVREIPGVLAADDVTGPFDVVVRVEAPSMDELGRLVEPDRAEADEAIGMRRERRFELSPHG